MELRNFADSTDRGVLWLLEVGNLEGIVRKGKSQDVKNWAEHQVVISLMEANLSPGSRSATLARRAGISGLCLRPMNSRSVIFIRSTSPRSAGAVILRTAVNLYFRQLRATW